MKAFLSEAFIQVMVGVVVSEEVEERENVAECCVRYFPRNRFGICCMLELCFRLFVKPVFRTQCLVLVKASKPV